MPENVNLLSFINMVSWPQWKGEREMTLDLTQGTPWRGTLRFTLPLLLGNLLQQLYNTADTIIVGNYISDRALSAVGACTSLTMLFTALALGFSIGAGVLVAQYFGAQKERELRQYAATSMLLLLGLGIAASVLGVLLAKPLLVGLLQTPEALRDMAVTYFAIYAVGLVFQFGYNIAAAILRAIGDSKATLYFLLASSLLNVVLDLLLVAVVRMGVAGAAIATVLSQVCSCVLGFWYMHRKYPLLRFTRRELIFSKPIAKRVLVIGAPMALQQSVVSCGFMFLQRLVNSCGEDMVASFTVGSRIENYLTLPAIAFQSTMATYTGQNIGAQQPARVSRGLWQTALLAMLVTLPLSLIVYCFAPQLIRLFAISGPAAAYCAQHLHVAAFAVLIFALYFPCNGLLQGAGEGFYATFCAFLALGVRVLLAYTLIGTQLFRYTSIWWSQLLAWVVTMLFCYCHYFRGTWKTRSLVQ